MFAVQLLLLCHADQQWGCSAAALQQALVVLATSRPTKRLRTRSSHAPDQPSEGTRQAQHPSSQTAQAPADALAPPSNPVDLHIAGGSALHGGPAFGLHAAFADKMVKARPSLSEQGASEQALHFAHDLLGNALSGLPLQAVQLWGCLVTKALESTQGPALLLLITLRPHVLLETYTQTLNRMPLAYNVTQHVNPQKLGDSIAHATTSHAGHSQGAR